MNFKPASEKQVAAARAQLLENGGLPDGLTYRPGQDPEFVILDKDAEESMLAGDVEAVIKLKPQGS